MSFLTTTYNPHWKAPVASAAALPASGNTDGDVRVTLDTHSIYMWTGSSWLFVDGLGAGDVVGPGSSTDNAIARFDGSTGKVVQNSGILIDDSNSITGVNSLTVTTLVAVTTITTGDNLIVLNDDVVGTPTENAGIQVTRGTSPTAQLLWDETTDRWVAGEASPSTLLFTSDTVDITTTQSVEADLGFYVGDRTTDGSWRMVVSGTDLVVEKRVSGSWVEKGRFYN